MDDAEFVFNQTSAERKRVARGARNKVRGGGRVVRLPYDNMTREEKAAMNGEVKSYDLSAPMEWKAFRAMPLDIQQEYLDKIVERFDAPNAMIAEMFGVSDNTFNPYLWRNKIKIHREGRKASSCKSYLNTADGEAYMRWVIGENEPIAEPAVIEEEPVAMPVAHSVEETEIKPEERSVKVNAGNMDINNIAVLLKSLVGTGAKLTIEINL